MRIGVLDDSEEHLGKVCDEAATLGHHVSFVANSGAEAIEALNAHEVDVIISDLVLPGADGIELMRKIRSTRRDLRVVAVSGSYLEKSMLPTSKLSDTSTVLPKTYRLSELDAAIAGSP